MTKTWKKVPSERTVLDKMNCDLCKKESRKDDWTTQGYDIAETEISIREGTSYPEGGYGTEITFDICIDCFKNKIIPWFKSQGIIGTEKDWDY